MEKETLEEAAHEYFKRGQLGFEKASDTEEAFLRGGLWQSERMYSEEEIETIAKDAYAMGRKGLLIGVFNRWFEQFKK